MTGVQTCALPICRTVDESGDYTVKKWPIQILDHQSATPDSTKFTVALDPGKGYIKGYEFGTDAQTYITLDRARDYDQADNLDVSVDFGNYVVVSNVKGLFSTNVTTTSDTAAVGNYSAVELHSAVHGSVSGSGTKIGTANVRFMQWVGSNAPGSTATYRMYLFNIKMDGSNIFGSTKSVVIRSGATVLSGGDINAASKQAGSGQTFLTGSDVPGLVFPLANQYIKTIRDSLGNTQTDYKTQRTYTGVSFTSGSASIQTDNGLERFVGGSGALSDTLKYTNFHAVITSVSNAGSTGYVVGDIIRFDTASTRSITLTTPTVGTPHQATFDVNDAAFTATVTIIAAINANTQTERVKSLSDYKIKILGTGSGGGLNVTKGGKDSLAVSDVYEVVGIYNTGTTNPTGVTIDPVTGTLTWDVVSHTDVTSRYTVDNGQRPEFYDHGNIILTGTAPTSSHYLLVVYRNFTHTGSGFLSRDSYGIPYEDIPEFIDPTSGKTYVLRDCIDFRPRRADGATTLEGGQIPDPTDTLNADYQYYLARMDRIVATADRQFVVKRGIPEVYPKVPVDESNGMTLYVVVIPPYTANVRDIQVRYFDNKRYTMRDIGRLEKRISNLEYYTQLSLLEKAAKDMSIQDSSVPPLQKFKNGFAVDPFTSLDVFVESASNPEAWANRRWGWWNAWFNGSTNWNFQAQNYNANSLAQPSNVDFNAAIDPVNQELRAPFTIQFSEFDTGTLTSTIKEGDLVTLSYTEALAINQPLASTYINVNPFNVIRFIGTITLEPSFDL